MFALRQNALPTAMRSARAFSTTPVNRFAKMTIIGRLADQPEIQGTSTGRDIVKYVLGTDSGFKENKQTSWFRVTSFDQEGPRRDYFTSLPKGTLLYIEADAKMDLFNDADGNRKSALNLVQRHFEVLKRPNVPEAAATEGEQH